MTHKLTTLIIFIFTLLITASIALAAVPTCKDEYTLRLGNQVGDPEFTAPPVYCCTNGQFSTCTTTQTQQSGGTTFRYLGEYCPEDYYSTPQEALVAEQTIGTQEISAFVIAADGTITKVDTEVEKLDPKKTTVIAPKTIFSDLQKICNADPTNIQAMITKGVSLVKVIAPASDFTAATTNDLLHIAKKIAAAAVADNPLEATTSALSAGINSFMTPIKTVPHLFNAAGDAAGAKNQFLAAQQEETLGPQVTALLTDRAQTATSYKALARQLLTAQERRTASSYSTPPSEESIGSGSLVEEETETESELPPGLTEELPASYQPAVLSPQAPSCFALQRYDVGCNDEFGERQCGVCAYGEVFIPSISSPGYPAIIDDIGAVSSQYHAKDRQGNTLYCGACVGSGVLASEIIG